MSQVQRAPARQARSPQATVAVDAFPVSATRPSGPGSAVALIIPTRNEAMGIKALLRRLRQLPEALLDEVIFVDDSDDGTPAEIDRCAPECPFPVRVLHRGPAERAGGLGSAVVLGISHARATWVAVMDADLQHPPEVLAQMLTVAQQGPRDLVIATRSSRASMSPFRAMASNASENVARVLFPSRLRGVSDPMSGFFLVRRGALRLETCRPSGFKVLLEILVRTPALKTAEVHYNFGRREAGESKANLVEGLRYAFQLLNLRLGGLAGRAPFVALIGLTGLLVNLGVTVAFTELAGITYLVSAVLATQASSLWNFGLSDQLVYKDRQESVSVWRRALTYLALNNSAHLVRIPALYVLVSVVGIHYLVAALLTLLALFAVRIVASERWIWRHIAEEEMST